MSNQRDFEDQLDPVEQRINAQLDIIETHYLDDCLQLFELLADVDLAEGERLAEIMSVAAEQADDAIFRLFLARAKVPGIGVERAKVAAKQIMDRCGLKREVR